MDAETDAGVTQGTVAPPVELPSVHVVDIRAPTSTPTHTEKSRLLPAALPSEPLPEKGDAAIVDIGVTVDDAVRTYSVYTLEAKGIAELDAEAVVFQAWSTEDMPRPLGIYHMMALRTHNTSGVEELFHKDITEEIDDFRRVFRYRVRNVTFSQLWTQAKDARLHAEKYGDFVRTFDENLRKYFTTHVPKGRTIKLKHIKCCFFTLMMIYNPLILILAFVDFVLRKLRLY